MKAIHLSIEDLSKSYAGIHALAHANLEFYQGEVHALLGENGAGKSTLCKMLSGAIRPDGGTIQMQGKIFRGFSPQEAKKNGISMIYQEFNLVPEMTVYENLFLGKEIRRGLHINKAEMIKQTKELFDSLGISIDPEEKICNLSVAFCQLVEIGKAVLDQVKLLIMDEPTAPLTTQEVEALFLLVRQLKSQGVTIIYISHRIEELLELSDRITIMRDGCVIHTVSTKETSRQELIRDMVGRELGTEFPVGKQIKIEDETPVLEVKNLTANKIKNISFQLYRGEILGLAGLVGAGRTEVIRAIYGADPVITGEIYLKGKMVSIKSPRSGIQKGIVMIPEDRKRQGLHLGMSIRENISLSILKRLCRLFNISRKGENKLADRFIKELSIKLASREAYASSLSGGNQQKVVLAKYLTLGTDIIFLDEPTRGIDVGAKKEIYDLIDSLRKQGKAIIMISSEMPEVVGLCTRVLVLCEGNLEGELSGEEITQENILELASGNQ